MKGQILLPLGKIKKTGKITKEEILNHWVNMPEYDNIKEPPPAIVVTFKFKNRKDFEEFNELLKKNIYRCNKVFDGRQRKDKKEAWYPLREKGSDYEYR